MKLAGADQRNPETETGRDHGDGIDPGAGPGGISQGPGVQDIDRTGRRRLGGMRIVIEKVFDKDIEENFASSLKCVLNVLNMCRKYYNKILQSQCFFLVDN